MQRLTAILVVSILSNLAQAEVVSERWAGKGVECAHPDALKSDLDGQATIAFDLSALPADTKIIHASLFCQTRDGLQPIQPPHVFDARAGGKQMPRPLEGPFYNSFDVTADVAGWVKDPKSNMGFLVIIDNLIPAKSSLEIRYETKSAKRLPEPVTGLKAVHHDGQTFLVFKEIPMFVPAAEKVKYIAKFSHRGQEAASQPGKGAYDRPAHPAIDFATLRDLQGYQLRDKPSGFQGIKPLVHSRKMPEVRYRVYRHAEKITPANIAQAQLVGAARPLAAWDERMGARTFKGEYIDQQELGDSLIPIAGVEEGKPLSAGEDWFAVNTDKAGKSFYAVTTVIDGTENLSAITESNSLPEPVDEKPGTPAPVLQLVQEFPQERSAGIDERFYFFFAAPPFTNLPVNRPLYVIVTVPPSLNAAGRENRGQAPIFANSKDAKISAGPPANSKDAKISASPPANSKDAEIGASPLIIDFFACEYSMLGAARVPSSTAMTLLMEHMVPWGGDADLGFNEGMGTLRPYSQCFVQNFSERYAVASIEWARRTWKLDPARIFGGQHDSGPLHFGIRHPEIFARIFVGHYTASYDIKWAPGSGGLTKLLGPRGMAKTHDGQDAWNQVDLGWYVQNHQDKDIPYMTLFSSVGKDSGHTSEFGWQDDPRGWGGLAKARQPFMAAWSVQSGNSQGLANAWVFDTQPEMTAALPKMKLESAMPAFSNCSLDNNPGNGDPADGDYVGQINAYLLWDDSDCVDKPDRWEMTVWVVKTCPLDACTTDITPRHCKAFKPKPGEKFKWANTPAGADKPLQSGELTADKWGLVTVPAAAVNKGKNRIAITKN